MKQKGPLLITAIFCYLLLEASVEATSDGTAHVCPDVPDGSLGTCDLLCNSREEGSCTGDQLCCSNGCGMACQNPVVACTVNGITQRVGERFPARDGCNTCECTESGEVSCTEIVCPTTTTATRVCPTVPDDVTGTCDSLCNPNEDSCTGDQLCCSNGCGMACQNPVVACTVNGITRQIEERFQAEDGCNTCYCTQTGAITCTDALCPTMPPQACPTPRNGSDGIVGTCALECVIGDDDNCPDGQFCCSNGCGTSCVNSVTVCEGRNGVQYQVGESVVSDDGCNSCTCNSQGVLHCTDQTCPSSIGCPRINQEVCIATCSDASPCSNDDHVCCPGLNECRVCVQPVTVCSGIDGTVYQVGDTFPTGDGCNECTCLNSGRVVCTLRLCVDRCYLRPELGDCPPATRYFYDSSTSLCLNFTGGCGEEDHNDFATPRDCYSRCSPHSICNADIYPPNFDPRCDLVERRWTFNATTNQCMEIGYRACEEESQRYNVFRDLETCRNTCMRRPTTSSCPVGVPVVLCFADPCEVSTCPNFPSATCVANFCGGCNAYYFDSDGNNVTDRCDTPADTCDNGLPMVRCFANPCDTATCPQFPDAECVPNYCGGCNYNFLVSGNDVTRQCNRAVPVPITQAVCPFRDQSMGGICVESCSRNTDCIGDELCCSNGCGSACIESERIPYYNIPPVCPQPELRDLYGICSITDESCSMNSDCEDDELCCRDRCGRRCMDAVRSSTPCYLIVERILEASTVGGYVPTCGDDGTFRPVQCNNLTELCWCVNTLTGRPVSSYSPRGTTPQCSGCSYNGEDYRVGSSFPSEDGCNKCECSDGGIVFCSTNECVDLCTLPPVPGPCRGSIRAFHYDQRSGRCLPFTYGGCEGNANKFKNVRDCLMRCDSEDDCLDDPAVPCDTTDVQSFIFNSTSGQCERCNRNDNRFSTVRECIEECSPGTIPIDLCLDVICERVDCPSGTEIVRDEQHCCPYCSRIVRCEDDEYRCADGTCIPLEHLCDDIRDCSDGADEEFCEDECEFSCGDQTCIPRSQVCDGVVDCRDGADIRNCTDFSNVYYLTSQDIPVACPDATDSLGACVIQCTTNENCRDGTICCSNGCGGRTCVNGTQYEPLCPSILRQSDQSGRLGVFRPQCEEDGSFSEVQCHGSTGFCWCVDIRSGQPVSEGLRGRPECRGCRGPNGEEIGVGESYRTDDGCNTCTCTGVNSILCTIQPCDAAPCRFQNRMIPSNTTFDDECNTCYCFAGSLRCTRKACIVAGVAEAVKRAIRTRLPFDGDFDLIRDRLEDFRREIIRLFLDKYANTLGVTQDQIQDIEVMKGSVIVILTLIDSNTTTSGANVTVLVGQVQQDYETGLLVIRYEDQILTPSGEFQTGDGTPALLTWHIIVIVIGIVIILAVAIVILVFVVLAVMKKSSDEEYKHGNATNDYDLPDRSAQEPEGKKELA